MADMHVSITNVGGIKQTEMTFERGVTLVTGENATNKSSLLQALLFALGVDSVPIRTGADRAVVELRIGDQKVERTATRSGRGTSISGDPLVDEDTELFARFGALLATNPLRTSVEANADFEDLLKGPMNIDTLERERERKLDRKRTLRNRLDELEDVDSEVESTESDLATRRDEVESLSEQLSELYEELPEQNGDIEEVRTRRTEVLTRRDRLAEQIEDMEAAVDRLDSRIETLEAELENAREAEERADIASLRQERSELRAELDDVDDRVEVLQSAVTANREMLDTDVRGLLEFEAGLEEDTIECWACGNRSPISSFEETVDQLTELIEQEMAKRREYEPELEEIESKIQQAEEARREVSRLENDLQSAKNKRDSRQQSVEDQREQLSELEAELVELDAEIEEIQADRATDQSETSQEIEETRVEMETKRREVERLESKLETLREKRDEREAAADELDELTDEIHELTERIENLESDLRSTFNDAMDELIDTLAFEDIERIWLDGDFDLVIAREVDGTVQEDSVENLAESERAIIGLVLGLAGYLVYDVESTAPFLVLDSLGAFDAARMNELVDYFGDHAEFLIAAVHPEQIDDDEPEHKFELAPGHR